MSPRVVWEARSKNRFKKGLGSAWNSPSRAIKLKYIGKHWLGKSLGFTLLHAGRIYWGETLLYFYQVFYSPFIGHLLVASVRHGP